MRKPRPSSQSLTPIPPAATIFAIHDTLHLLFHHNKNQHRGAKWFKWLGLLKRWVHKLAVEVETAQSQVRLELAIEDDEAQGIREIMLHLGRDLVPRCYGAFSNVVADKQFSALGIVLISALAEIANLPGMPKFDTVFPPSVEVPEVVINLPVAFTDTGDTGVVVPRPKEGEIEEDAGEVVSRTATYADATTKAMKNGQQQQQTNVAPQPLTSKPKQGKKRNMQLYESVPVQLDLISASKSEPQGDAESRIKEKERKRKKRKKGNAIDDIFGAFG